MNSNLNENTIRLYIPGASKTRVIVGTDEHGEEKAIYLNLDDQDIVKRLYAAYDELLAKAKEFENLKALDKGLGGIDDKNSKDYFEEKEKVLKAAQEIIDGVFEAPVCEMCSAGGTLFDVLRETGQYRYDAILASLSSLYTEAIQEGSEKLNKAREQHTEKDTKK